MNTNRGEKKSDLGLVGVACIQNSDSEETGQGQTINSYTNKPINKFKVQVLLDDSLSCTHRILVGLDIHAISIINSMVTLLFGINSTSNVIEIVRGEAECYFNCFTSAIDP